MYKRQNKHWWPTALALAWAFKDTPRLQHELAAVYQDHFASDGFKYSEALQAAGSVLRRLKTNELYTMKNDTFLVALDAIGSERMMFAKMTNTNGNGKNLNRSQWSIGAMGYEKMSGLSFDEYRAETKRRQAEAGKYAAFMRETNAGGRPATISAHGAPWEAEGISRATWYRRRDETST